MALDDTYATLADLKAWLDLAEDEHDAVLGACLIAASRAVDRLTNRFFFQMTDTNLYSADSPFWLAIDDLVAVTALATDLDGDRVYETTWAPADYDLSPANADSLGWPFTVLETIPFRMQRWFPSWRRGVQVTGVWGWPAVPDPVRQATLIYAHKLFKRADSPLGVQAITPDAPGVVIRKRDPDADALLAPYVRALVAA